jgi:hypothetical protein
MKSLLLTGFLLMGVAHTGAFLSLWELPHVEDHITLQDFGRKLNKVTKWDEKKESLRDARAVAREQNYDLYKTTPGELAKRKAQAKAHKNR